MFCIIIAQHLTSFICSLATGPVRIADVDLRAYSTQSTALVIRWGDVQGFDIKSAVSAFDVHTRELIRSFRLDSGDVVELLINKEMVLAKREGELIEIHDDNETYIFDHRLFLRTAVGLDPSPDEAAILLAESQSAASGAVTSIIVCAVNGEAYDCVGVFASSPCSGEWLSNDTVWLGGNERSAIVSLGSPGRIERVVLDRRDGCQSIGVINESVVWVVGDSIEWGTAKRQLLDSDEIKLSGVSGEWICLVSGRELVLWAPASGQEYLLHLGERDVWSMDLAEDQGRPVVAVMTRDVVEVFAPEAESDTLKCILRVHASELDQ